jgi:hypothetical protein
MKQLALFSLFAIAQCGFADIIPTVSTVTQYGLNYNWDYTVNVTVDQNVLSGNYFTIYDFGTVLASAAPAGWTMSQALTGVTPSLVLPFDDPTVNNVTFTYTGSPILGSSILGDFILKTTGGFQVPGQFAGLGTRNSGPQAGSTIANVGMLTVPAISGLLTTAPEPSQFLLIGVGLGVLGIIRTRKTRKA